MTSLEVGAQLEWRRVVTAEHVRAYADITGDRNPLHFDEDFAARSRFGKLIVHGGITAGTLNALVAEKLAAGAVFLEQELKYVAPACVGDELVAHGTITWKHESKPVVKLDVRVTATDTGASAAGGDAEAREVLTGKVVVYIAAPKPAVGDKRPADETEADPSG